MPQFLTVNPLSTGPMGMPTAHKSIQRISNYNSGRSTPKSGRSTPGGRRPFVEDRSKAVFLTGLRKTVGAEYDTYRNRCYDDIQIPMGNQRIYILKFDFPQNSDHAFLHVRTPRMAEFLKTKRTLILDNEPIKVYDYSRSANKLREDGKDQLIINVEDRSHVSSAVTTNPLKVCSAHNFLDSCYQTHVGTPEQRSRSQTPGLSMSASAEASVRAESPVVVAPALQRQNTEHDDVQQQAGYDHLQEQLEIISRTQRTEDVISPMSNVSQPLTHIADLIRLPQNMFDNDTYANLKVQAVMIISNGLMTVDQFNAQFAEMFNSRCKSIVGQAMTENLVFTAANAIVHDATPDVVNSRNETVLGY